MFKKENPKEFWVYNATFGHFFRIVPNVDHPDDSTLGCLDVSICLSFRHLQFLGGSAFNLLEHRLHQQAHDRVGEQARYHAFAIEVEAINWMRHPSARSKTPLRRTPCPVALSGKRWENTSVLRRQGRRGMLERIMIGSSRLFVKRRENSQI
jgi:hypothetical protein